MSPVLKPPRCRDLAACLEELAPVLDDAARDAHNLPFHSMSGVTPLVKPELPDHAVQGAAIGSWLVVIVKTTFAELIG